MGPCASRGPLPRRRLRGLPAAPRPIRKICQPWRRHPRADVARAARITGTHVGHGLGYHRARHWYRQGIPMSRAIQVRVSESVVRTVHVEDGVQSPLELLPVLAPERMAELLAKELEAQGFIRDGKLAQRKVPDGVEITVDLEASTVSVKLAADCRLSEQVDLETRAAGGARARAGGRVRDAAIDELEQRLAQKTEALRREVTDKLEKKLADLRGELDGTIGRATVAALTAWVVF